MGRLSISNILGECKQSSKLRSFSCDGYLLER
jgi:hypothetical protein